MHGDARDHCVDVVIFKHFDDGIDVGIVNRDNGRTDLGLEFGIWLGRVNGYAGKGNER